MGRSRIIAILVFAILTIIIGWDLIGQARKIASAQNERMDFVNSILADK